MRIQRVFRGCSILTQLHSRALSSIQRVFNTHSKAFTCTHKRSRGVQYSLKGIHVHSQAFRACSVLTQMRSSSWSHHGESHSKVTQWVFTLTHWVFTLTQWHSCALNGCSGALPTHSLTFMHTQWVFRGCSDTLNGVQVH